MSGLNKEKEDESHESFSKGSIFNFFFEGNAFKTLPGIQVLLKNVSPPLPPNCCHGECQILSSMMDENLITPSILLSFSQTQACGLER
jgi:hypothetical protein